MNVECRQSDIFVYHFYYFAYKKKKTKLNKGNKIFKGARVAKSYFLLFCKKINRYIILANSSGKYID